MRLSTGELLVGRQDMDATKLPKIEQVVIATYNDMGVSITRTLQDNIIIRVTRNLQFSANSDPQRIHHKPFESTFDLLGLLRKFSGCHFFNFIRYLLANSNLVFLMGFQDRLLWLSSKKQG